MNILKNGCFMMLHTLLLNWLSSFSLVVSSSLLAANNLLLLNSKAFRSSFSLANLSLAVSASFAKRLALKEEEENMDYHTKKTWLHLHKSR